MDTKDTSGSRQVPHRIKERAKSYRMWSTLLQVIFIGLAITSVVTALVAATYTDQLQNGVWLKALTFTSALCTGLLNYFNLQGKTSDIWGAFRHLEQAILEYSDGTNPDIDKLIASHKEAESMVGFISFKKDQ